MEKRKRERVKICVLLFGKQNREAHGKSHEEIA